MAVRAQELIQRVSLEGLNNIAKDLRRTGTQGEDAFQRIQREARGVPPQVNKTTDSVQNLDNRLDNLVPTLGRIAAAFGVAFGGRELIQAADEFTNIENKIRAATDSAAEYDNVMARVQAISRETRTAIGDNAQAFVRFNVVMGQMGQTQDDTLDIIETLNKSIQLSGISSQEASAGVRQLAQAFGSGRLSGDEFRSVMENLPPVAEAIKEELFGARASTAGLMAEMREMARNGEIDSRVMMNAIKRIRDQADKDFADMELTVSSSMVVMRNAFTVWVGEVDNFLGATAGLSTLILALADNFEIVGSAITSVGAAMIIAFGPRMLAMVLAFFTAIQRHPFIALASAIVAVVTYLVQMRDQWKVVGDAIDEATRRMRAFIDWVKRAVDWVRTLGGLRGGDETPAQQRAGGGPIIGPGSDTSDNIRALLSPGEFVVRAQAVRRYGVRFFDMLNRMMLPNNVFDRFAIGGYVASTTGRFAEGGLVGEGQEPYAVLNLTVGSERFEGLIAPRTVANKLVQFSNSEQVSSAGRKPGWYR